VAVSKIVGVRVPPSAPPHKIASDIVDVFGLIFPPCDVVGK
jgi:hypothetical protein